jgi:hypothetical protein
MTSDCLPHSGTRSIASKAFESSSSPKRSSRRMPTMPALNTAPTRRPSRRTRRATAPNTAPPPPLLLPRAPRPTAPSRAARTSWSAPRSSSCLEVRAHHDAPLRGMQVLTTRCPRCAACKCSPRRPILFVPHRCVRRVLRGRGPLLPVNCEVLTTASFLPHRCVRRRL